MDTRADEPAGSVQKSQNLEEVEIESKGADALDISAGSSSQKVLVFSLFFFFFSSFFFFLFSSDFGTYSCHFLRSDSQKVLEKGNGGAQL